MCMMVMIVLIFVHDEKAMAVVVVILMGAGCRYPASGGDEINQSEPRALLLLCPPPRSCLDATHY